VSILGRNIAANFVGSALILVFSFVFVPFTIKLMGIEAYGLVGFFATLCYAFTLLDFGLSATMVRETARRAALAQEAAGLRDLARTLELVYWSVGAAIGLALVALAPTIAAVWLNPEALSQQTLAHAIMLMGLTLAFQWPSAMYGGGLKGLQRQVALNALQIATAAARGGGAVLVLATVSATPEAFFAWQALVGLANAAAMRLMLWRSLPHSARAGRFDGRLLRTLWRFAAGMTGISLVSIVIVQADKMILSAVLPLEQFALYVLAGSLAAAAIFPAQPVATAIYPRLTASVAQQAETALRAAYHRATQLLVTLTLPLALTLAAFAREVVLFWTHDAAVADGVAPIARVLVAGSALHALMILPYMLQLARGATRLTLEVNAIAAVVLVPALLVLAQTVGPLGAASVWLLLNLSYVLFVMPLLHARFLPGATRVWLTTDVGLPAAATILTVGAGRLLVPVDLAPLAGFAAALLVGGFALCSAAAATPAGRGLVVAVLRNVQAALARAA
jgi:O-antigen/teichoic acid export membrane protein